MTPPKPRCGRRSHLGLPEEQAAKAAAELRRLEAAAEQRRLKAEAEKQRRAAEAEKRRLEAEAEKQRRAAARTPRGPRPATTRDPRGGTERWLVFRYLNIGVTRQTTVVRKLKHCWGRSSGVVRDAQSA